MGGFWSRLKGIRIFRDTREPIKGIRPRLKNIAFNNFRGLLGCLIPICVVPPHLDTVNVNKNVEMMWIWMFWFFLLQPVAIPTTALIPIFFLPFMGCMDSNATCKCYFNENIALFVLASMLLLLLNNSGYDRRVAVWLLSSGDDCQYSGKRMVFKVSMAAFILSIFSQRLIVTSSLMQYVTPIYADLAYSYGTSTTEPSYKEMGYIINNAIQTSAAIGSIAVIHSSYATLAFRAIMCQIGGDSGKEFPDIFNYFQYSAYAFPLALLMWILNVIYHMLLINFCTKKAMTSSTRSQVRNAILKFREPIPKKITPHEVWTIIGTICSLIVFFTRWNRYSNNGWADSGQPASTTEAAGGGGDAGERRFRAVEQESPVIKDAVAAAMFVIILHIVPKDVQFMKVFRVDKKSEVKDVKASSGIMWWRYIDQNLNYGYIFLIGSGIAIYAGARETGLAQIIGDNIGKSITGKSWNSALFIVCIITCVLANVMSGVAALVIFLPLVLLAGEHTEVVPWGGKLYLAALGVGVGSSLGFMFPFMYTPAYFCHHIGKVPKLKMAKYSFPIAVICMLLLWASLIHWAPYLWDPTDKGIKIVARHAFITTTTAASAGGGD